MDEISCKNVVKRFGDKTVINNITLKINTGILGLLGPNGIGKSTLIKMLTGLINVDAGEFYFNKQKINLESLLWHKNIGYLPQSPGLYPLMTVYDFLDYMLLLSRWKNQKKRDYRINEVCNILNIENFLNTPIGQLSGGTLQRVALGQAIVHDPLILILDEPTNNLDTEERDRFHRFLLTQVDKKIIIYIGHIINELYNVCSRLLILGKEGVSFDGTPDELMHAGKDHLKEIEMNKDQFAQFNNETLRVVDLIFNKTNSVTVRFDARFADLSGSVVVEPKLEEAYKLFINSSLIN